MAVTGTSNYDGFMVLPGQFLERPAIISVSEDVVLEGLFHRGNETPGLLVCPAVDPLGNAGMHAPVVAELAFACARHGRPSLRFAHRGMGASLGEVDPSKALEDAEAAFRHLEASVGSDLSVAGYLTGVRTAVSLTRRVGRVRHLVLVAPTEAIELGGIEAEVFVVLPEASDRAVRDSFVRSFEKRPDAIELVGEADERFHRGLDDLSRRVSEWLSGGVRTERRRSDWLEEAAARLAGLQPGD
ncbi:MAG: alpha/beta hydrolase [Deltaproteobacteria bacterium]|nr:alpha/beta hydrolase [Deltaproteobacteria bacterium]